MSPAVGLLSPYLLPSESGSGRSTMYFLKYPCLIRSDICSFGYLFFQLKAILGVMSMVVVELIVLIFISFLGISFDFIRPLDEFLVLDFCEYLGDGSV